MRRIGSRGVLAVVVGTAAAVTAACGSNGSDNQKAASAASGPVTLTWWHNGTSDPLKGVWQGVANSYHAAHPKVTIKVQPIQNEQFTTKVPLALQSSDPPEVYQQWGGGQEATQVQSGKLMDLTPLTQSWIKQIGPAAAGWQVNGRQYGVPFDLHIVGFWYRKDLFQKAGIASPPSTLADLNADVAKLKQSGVAPIAIGSKDRWPDAFWWEYFAVRECPTSVLKSSMKAQQLSDPCFTKAGNDTQAFLATKPFQTGFLGTPAQQGAGSSAGMVANGKAAMELQGDWEPGTMAALTSDKKLNDKLGWFPFPSVPGGKGDPNVALGGGDGFSCTTKGTVACADFLRYIDSAAVQKKLVESGAASLPANPAAASAIKIPAVKDVLDYSKNAAYIQTYFDIALPTAPGQALDDAVADFFAGKGSADSVPKSVQ